MTAADPVKVLFIGGMGRSGSTLLDRMLGSVPGVVSIGEFRKLWRRGLDANELCGCGEPILSCPFWTAVVDDAFGGLDGLNLRRALRVEDRLLRSLKTTASFRIRRLRHGSFRPDLEAFASYRVPLFRSIAKVSGASLVVDSSKGPLYGMALAESPGLRVTPVHLVRDGRAVAYSWSRRKEVRRTTEHSGLMPTLATPVAAGQWLTKSLQMELGWPGGRRPLRVHYEEMVLEPKATVRKLLRRAGHPIPDEQLGEESGSVRLGVDHTVLGNPSRFEQGEVAVRLDDEWQRAMRPSARAAFTALTLPVLTAYGYTWPGHRGQLGRRRRGGPPLMAADPAFEDDAPAPDPLKVVFIGGYTRSGSTLLDRLIGRVPGVMAVGEVRHIWGMGFIEDRFCGCGTPFRECPFWREVVGEAFGGFDGVDAAAIRREEETLFRARYAPLLASGRLPKRLAEARARFVERRAAIFRAIAHVSGAHTIVDSSKNPSYGLLLAGMEGIDVRTLHLVRDSRATSYSWTRVKADPRHAGRTDYFPRRRPAVSATWWTANGLLMELTERLGRRPHLRVRYESLVRHPGRELGRVARFTGLPRELLAPDSAGPFDLGVHHSIGGNPVRFEQGPIALKADDAWRTEMGRGSKALVTAISWPLLAWYGYLWRPL